MISLDRAPETPQEFLAANIQPELDKITNIFQENGELKSKDFNSKIWGDFVIREILWKSQNNKCGYCETPIPLKRTSDIDHYRPKAGVTGVPDHPGYWWLAYDWRNYIYSCRFCNQEYKKNEFPLIDDDTRSFDGKKIEAENPALLNPFDDEPETLISYSMKKVNDNHYVYLFSGPLDMYAKANSTKDTCGLNRPELMRDRAIELKKFISNIKEYEQKLIVNNNILIERCEKAIIEQLHPTSPFVGMKLYYLREFGYEEQITRWTNLDE